VMRCVLVALLLSSCLTPSLFDIGALFRDSASRVLKHYRGYVHQIEKEAQELAKRQVEEEENRQYYLENRDVLESEYRFLLEMNSSRLNTSNIEDLVNAWSGGGAGGIGGPGQWGRFGGRDQNGSTDGVDSTSNSNKDMMNNLPEDQTNTTNTSSNSDDTNSNSSWLQYLWPFRGNNMTANELMDKAAQRAQQISQKRAKRDDIRKARAKERALREAAKVVVDYRPVMSRIIDDYLFRCPSWHLAQSISRTRRDRGKKHHRSDNNVFVYQFSHSTHIPGFPECWGKSCHTAEMPYVFQAMDVIRSNYSTLGPHAQREAPSTPEYPYTDMILAYKGVMEATAAGETESSSFADYGRGNSTATSATHQDSLSKGFQRILGHFFGDYFKEDADEEIASDMADRWVAFARTGTPNHDASPTARWRPWRYLLDENHREDKKHRSWQPEDFDRLFSAIGVEEEGEEIELNKTDASEFVWSDDPAFRSYRRRTLSALGMRVVEEDVFQTLLSRTKKRDDDDSFFDALFGNPGRTSKDNLKAKKVRRQAIRRLQQIAQDLGFIGAGLRGEPKRAGVPGHRNDALWEEDFFPEILELKWPPEGRLVERDCTCDLWDKIRYRY
jgi:Carboxylesterase family